MGTYGRFQAVRGVTYGPVLSRRLGRSLGLNILPFGMKVCSFNCSYCQLGRTPHSPDPATLEKLPWPTAEEVAEAFEEALAETRERKEHLDSANLAGNGEPTLNPDFLQICRSLLEVRDRAWPGLPVRILTNGTQFHRPDVIEGLNLLDDRIVKIDAGLPETFLAINRPMVRISLEQVCEGIRRLKDCVVQTMFIDGDGGNFTARDLEDWAGVVAEIRPLRVQIYSIARDPMNDRVRPVAQEKLEEIAARLREHTAINIEVF
ncbi:MAG: radical SAM protein [Planctomycetota bacterium]|jgi:wyosine [tRNA(Phe)-imidazoG37] synthetase (radical SAM superfamily)